MTTERECFRRYLIPIVLCLSVLAASQVTPAQIPVTVRLVIVDRDLNPKPVPKARIIIKQAGSPTPARFEATTDFDGIAHVSVPPD